MTKARDLANAGTALTSVSATELGYVDGVTSAIQTQIDSKIGQATAINPTIVDAKGDIIAATAADTVSRLAVGANDTVLTADSSTATGLKWAAVAAGSNYSILNSGGTSLSGATTITVSSISSKDKIMILLDDANADASSIIGIRLNTDTGSNYYNYGWFNTLGTSYDYTNFGNTNSAAATSVSLGRMSSSTGTGVSGGILINGCNSSGLKIYQSFGSGARFDGSGFREYFQNGYYNSASTISSISVISSSGNFTSGTVWVLASA